jgi:LEA14-like dessication related protein
MSDEEVDSVREKIVESQKQVLDHRSMAELLLATAVVLATFGTAAVLMPEEPTGAFSGDFEIENVQIEDVNIRGVEASETGITFVQDYEIENPNLLQAEFEAASYRINVEGESVDTGHINGVTVIDSGQTEMIALLHETALSERYSGTTPVTVEGKMIFKVGNQEFEKYYRNSFKAEFPAE